MTEQKTEQGISLTNLAKYYHTRIQQHQQELEKAGFVEEIIKSKLADLITSKRNPAEAAIKAQEALAIKGKYEFHKGALAELKVLLEVLTVATK